MHVYVFSVVLQKDLQPVRYKILVPPVLGQGADHKVAHTVPDYPSVIRYVMKGKPGAAQGMVRGFSKVLSGLDQSPVEVKNRQFIFHTAKIVIRCG